MKRKRNVRRGNGGGSTTKQASYWRPGDFPRRCLCVIICNPDGPFCRRRTNPQACIMLHHAVTACFLPSLCHHQSFQSTMKSTVRASPTVKSIALSSLSSLTYLSQRRVTRNDFCSKISYHIEVCSLLKSTVCSSPKCKMCSLFNLQYCHLYGVTIEGLIGLFDTAPVYTLQVTITHTQ